MLRCQATASAGMSGRASARRRASAEQPQGVFDVPVDLLEAGPEGLIIRVVSGGRRVGQGLARGVVVAQLHLDVGDQAGGLGAGRGRLPGDLERLGETVLGEQGAAQPDHRRGVAPPEDLEPSVGRRPRRGPRRRCRRSRAAGRGRRRPTRGTRGCPRGRVGPASPRTRPSGRPAPARMVFGRSRRAGRGPGSGLETTCRPGRGARGRRRRPGSARGPKPPAGRIP